MHILFVINVFSCSYTMPIKFLDQSRPSHQPLAKKPHAFWPAIFGPMGRFRTNEPSDQWYTFSDQLFSDQWHFRTNGSSDQWVFGLMGRRTNGLSDHRHGTFSMDAMSMVRRPIGPVIHWSGDPLVRWSIGPVIHWSESVIGVKMAGQVQTVEFPFCGWFI